MKNTLKFLCFAVAMVAGTAGLTKLHAQNIIETIAGTGVVGSTGDGGQAKLAEFNVPHGIFITPSGVIYIADATNNKIRKIDATGIITTIAGNGTAEIMYRQPAPKYFHLLK